MSAPLTTAFHSAVEQARRPDFWARFGVPVAFLLLVIYFSLASPAFLTADNIFDVLRQSSVIAVVAVGAALVFFCGGIDISQGAVMALTGLIVVWAITDVGLPPAVSLLLALAIGLACGAINGLLSEKVRIPAFIATLGTALVIRGVAYAWTDGQSIGLAPGEGGIVTWLGRGSIGPIPVIVLVAMLVYALAIFVMRSTVWGLHTYAIGSGENAARVAGLRVARHRIQVYAVAGVISALGGVLVTGRLASAAPNSSVGAEFDVITAVVLGGVSIYGGEGKLARVALAAVFLGTLANGLVLLNVDPFVQRVITGLVFLAALALDRLRTVGR